LSLPLLGTIVLISSGFSVSFAHRIIRLGGSFSNFFSNKTINSFLNTNKSYYSALVWLIVTIFFGIFFMYIQYTEYTSLRFSITSGCYGSIFFSLTGFHGFHVFVGLLFLLVSTFRVFLNHFTQQNHTGLEVSI